MKSIINPILITLLLVIPTISFSQFGITPATIFYGRTNPTIDGVGVGTFPVGTPTDSRFQINEFYMTGSTVFPNGRLFRTDGTIGNLNAWQFFTGATVGTSTEKFTLYTLPNSSEVNLQATQQTGELIFRTADTTERFRIRDTADQIYAFGNYPPYGANMFLPSYKAKFNINDRNKSLTDNTERTMLLRVWGRGFNRGVDPNGINTNYTLAEFIQSADNSSDAGILIQGSRAAGSNADLAFIDFGNNDITNGGDHVLSRVAVGIDVPQSSDPSLERGAYRIYTNAGISSPQNPNTGTGLIERFRITSNGLCGIGNYNNSSGQGVGTAGYINATLDIDGDLRIREVLQDNTLDSILVVDPSDRNRVYYRDISSLGVLGNSCSAANNPLTTNWEIPLGIFNFEFSGAGRVGIGTSCSPAAKFHVNQSGNSLPIHTAIIESTNATPANVVNNTLRVLNNSGKIANVAGFFRASEALKVYALIVPQGGGYVGFGTSAPSAQLHVEGNSIFNGNMTFNGTLTGTNNIITSDNMFKTNVEGIENATDLLLQLEPKEFFYDTTNSYGMTFPTQKQYGLIAQDVESILPELVQDVTKVEQIDTLGNVVMPSITYKALNYNGFFGLLIQGFKEQQNTIDSLENIIASQSESISNQDSINNALYTMITGCCSNNNAVMMNNGNGGSNTMNTTDVTLSDAKSIILNTAVPNPFADMTTITYVLTNEVRKAQMLFYDVNGKLINSVDLTPTEGQGRLNVFADDLSNGVYTYTLVADGQIIDTKRMVKQK